jgi:hypothetical protein
MPTDETLLRLQFDGKLLSLKGMAIYDLGQTLVAVQRAIYKAHLARLGTLGKSSSNVREVRRLLALQIETRSRGSDIYSLAPLITDPVAMTAVKEATKFFLEGLVSYTKGAVQSLIRQSPSTVTTIAPEENKRIYIGAIYADVVNIAERIENAGDCDSIKLNSPVFPEVESVTIDRETKQYVNSLKDQCFLGSLQDLEGNVTKLYPQSMMIEIKRPGGKKCKVHFQKADFDRVRYEQKRSSFIRVSGHPRYPLGFTGRAFDEFEATSVLLVEE